MHDGDYGSDEELDIVLEKSQLDHQQSRFGLTNPRTRTLQLEIDTLEQEIKGYLAEEAALNNALQHIKASRIACTAKYNEKIQQLKSLQNPGGNDNASSIDYGSAKFEWADAVLRKMKEVFNIDSFRLCQQGVVNAALDGRDIVCVMPTGGGKSLTYQLPAIIARGCTLVISPLLSLISDQIMHLRDVNIDAVKLTGGTSKDDQREITQRLSAMCGSANVPEIKLCYVTPEKIAKSGVFRSTLTKLANATRIVIDEAHCVSQVGHDFRPDYQKLHVLRQLYPHVPITAVSATCPPKVLEDLVKTLGLKPIVDGNRSDTEGTVYFSAPLYRRNLHYNVVTKHNEGNRVSQAMTDYILEKHPNDSGIVYCLSKKDAENIASELRTRSSGKIRTGVYHADRTDSEKEALHKQWRSGVVKVVCATIAFGLGIDKSDVRFVLHHSISKSLDGFYQESGRAGRDGKDSDCVLYYRLQDASTLSAMMVSEKNGGVKLRGMLRFAQDLKECRKLQFATYFSHSSQLSMSSWTTEESDGLARCGHCDNCTRDQDSLDERDVTYQTWQILKIVEEAERSNNNITLSMLASIARGGTAASGRGKGKEKASLDLDQLCGGKVDLKREELERLLVHLLLESYLSEKYHQNSYATISYMKLGPLAIRLTRLTKERAENQSVIKLVFVKSKGKSATKSTGKKRTKSTEFAEPVERTKSTKRRRISEGALSNTSHKDDEQDEVLSVEDDFARCQRIDEGASSSTSQKDDEKDEVISIGDDSEDGEASIGDGPGWEKDEQGWSKPKQIRRSEVIDVIEIDSD